MLCTCFMRKPSLQSKKRFYVRPENLFFLRVFKKRVDICVKSFCAPTNLDEQKAALVDKIFNVDIERIPKRSLHSKYLSVVFLFVFFSKKRTNKYITIHIYDLEATWNESVSKSFDVTLSNNGTQINFADIINFSGCSCSHKNRN